MKSSLVAALVVLIAAVVVTAEETGGEVASATKAVIVAFAGEGYEYALKVVSGGTR